MNPSRAVTNAIEIAKVALASCEIKAIPNEVYAEDVADFIETLAKRLEKMGEE